MLIDPKDAYLEEDFDTAGDLYAEMGFANFGTTDHGGGLYTSLNEHKLSLFSYFARSAFCYHLAGHSDRAATITETAHILIDDLLATEIQSDIKRGFLLEIRGDCSLAIDPDTIPDDYARSYELLDEAMEPGDVMEWLSSDVAMAPGEFVGWLHHVHPSKGVEVEIDTYEPRLQYKQNGGLAQYLREIIAAQE